MRGISEMLIIAFIAIVNVLSIRNIQVGDTVNLLNKNNLLNTIMSDIFNGYDGSNYVKKKVLPGNNYEMSHSTCLLFNSLKKYFYPKVNVDGELSPSLAANLFYHMDFWRDKNLGINKDYINDKTFRYGIVKLCKVVEVQSLDIELINEDDFPKAEKGTYYNILFNRTAVFRLKRDNETHYISSIFSGTCLIQIYIKDAITCMNNGAEQINDFFKYPIYRSSFRTVSNNHKLEDEINDYYFRNNLDYSLFSFSQEDYNHQENILRKFENNYMVSVQFKHLPELPALTNYRNNIMLLPLTRMKKQQDIIPGDVSNLSDLIDTNPRHIATKNLLIDDNDGKILSFTTYNYSSCHHFTEKQRPTFINGIFHVFEEMIKRDTYGVNPLYLNNEYTCLKLTICLILRKQKLKFSPTVVIKLSEESKNNVKPNVFEKKNIMLWLSVGRETHLVTRTEKGNCLYQMLIYPKKPYYYDDSSIFSNTPVFEGKILSAVNNPIFEDRMDMLVHNDLRNIVGSRKNLTIVSKVFDELRTDPENYALINLYLEELY